MNNRIVVLGIMGKSASGKNALQDEICRIYDAHRVVTTTTRPMRDTESQGVDYNFVTVEEFAEKIVNLKMLEATDFNNWFYGTEIGALHGQKVNIGVFNPAGIIALAEDPRIELRVVFVDTNDKIRLNRSLNREADPDCAEICRRFLADEKDFDIETMDEMADMNLNVIRVENNGNVSLRDIATKLAPFIFGQN